MSDEARTADTPPAGDGDGDGDERLPGRWIAITLASIVVAGAALGIFQTDAGNNESNTARETTRTAVGALRAGVLESDAKQLERDIEAESGALRRDQEAVARRAEAAGASAPPLGIEELRASVEPGSDLPIALTAEQVRTLSLDAARLRLTQAALAETRVTWNDRSTQYTTAIAMLAVALFFVGFSLVLRGPLRVLFYGVGVVFALGVIVWAVHIYTLSIPETPEAAIAATARGTVDAAEGAQTSAVAEFTRAIEIDGDFDEPYARRAISRVLEANPDYRQTGAVTGGQAAIDDAVADTRRALELNDGRDFLSLTFLSLLDLYGGEYDDAVDAVDAAIAINPDVPDPLLVRSAAEVGRGDAAAARASLDDARRLLSGSDPSERTRGLAAHYVSYLEQVRADSPERTGLAQELEQEIIGLETGFNLDRTVSGTVPARGSASVEGLRFEDGELRLRFRWQGLPRGTALSGIGFERPTAGGAWVQPRDLALFRDVSGTGAQSIAVPVERACTPIQVRVDIYLDGARAGSAVGPGGPAGC